MRNVPVSPEGGMGDEGTEKRTGWGCSIKGQARRRSNKKAGLRRVKPPTIWSREEGGAAAGETITSTLLFLVTVDSKLDGEPSSCVSSFCSGPARRSLRCRSGGSSASSSSSHSGRCPRAAVCDGSSGPSGTRSVPSLGSSKTHPRSGPFSFPFRHGDWPACWLRPARWVRRVVPPPLVPWARYDGTSRERPVSALPVGRCNGLANGPVSEFGSTLN